MRVPVRTLRLAPVSIPNGSIPNSGMAPKRVAIVQSSYRRMKIRSREFRLQGLLGSRGSWV